jgi:hypothetical protein
MGGEGSGRKPDIVKQMIQLNTPKEVPMGFAGQSAVVSEGFFIPNHSGIKTSPEAQGAFIKKNVNDSTTGTLTIANIISGGNLKHTGANGYDIYPENQSSIALRIAEDGTNLELAGLGTSSIEFQDVCKTVADQSSADTAYFANVLYGTDATPPTASNFPIGTIYLKYTA